MLDLDGLSEFPLECIDIGPANEGVVGMTAAIAPSISPLMVWYCS